MQHKIWKPAYSDRTRLLDSGMYLLEQVAQTLALQLAMPVACLAACNNARCASLLEALMRA